MTGPGTASSVNGSIKAERMEGQVELSTVNGFLEAGFQRIKGNPISLSSVNGPIKVSLPLGAGAERERPQSQRRNRCGFRGCAARAPGGHRLEAAVNGGGTHIRVQNVNGGISIHSTWNLALPPPRLVGTIANR